MPNWCSNELKVRIPPELVDKFLVPMGEQVRRANKKGGQ